MANYIFTTPVVEEGPSGGHRLFYFYKLNRGITVYLSGTTYGTGRWFTEDQLNAFDEYWLGGHEHVVSEETKDALIASGLDITEANFRAE